MQIFVLGMHRSGTSALARTLGLLGCRAGDPDDFPAADDANPRGYWERRDVWRLDEDLLQALDAAWDQVAHLDTARWISSLPDLPAWERRAREVVLGLDTAGRPWVVKDPRLCLLFPLWRRVLAAPVCVLVTRSPLSVARSLAVRDGFPLALGIALWELYVRSALSSSAGLPRLLVRYEDLIDRPRETAARLRADLEAQGVSGLAEPPDGALEAFLDPALERHPRESQVESDLLNPPQRALLDALAAGAYRDGGDLSLGAHDLLERHAAQSRRQLARRAELEDLHARLVETTESGARERAAFEQAFEHVAAGAEAERAARLELEWNAAQAITAERAARERAEAYAGEVTEQARQLQEKIARDSAVFALENAERLRLEAALRRLKTESPT